MYKRIGKRFVAVLLIVVAAFGLAAPAFASSSSWYDDFIDDLLTPSVSAPSGISSAVSDILYFSTLQTAVNGDAQALLTVQGDIPPADVSGLLQSGYQNYFSNYFTSDYSTTSTDRYVYVTLTDLQEFVRKLDNLPITLTYFPSTGVYVPVISYSAVSWMRHGARGYNPDKVKFWFSLASAEGGDSIEGAALKALPYVGDYILVAPAPDREPDFFPSDDKTSSSATTNHNYYTDSSSVDNSVNDNSVTTNTTIYEGGDTYNTDTFDYSNGTWYDNVTGTVNDIENLFYNPSTNTYTINNTYNITYEYNYTYYYNLGSSENLVQDYKFYYELPDGRSSADLTEDEIMGLSLEFDVVNYAEDRTDENTKILVPFDGSWEDIAYQGPDLHWVRGASITYRESAAFEGALYMDGSTTSIFGFDGKWDASKIPVNGMTLQFRYYLDALTNPTNANTWPFVCIPFFTGQSLYGYGNQYNNNSPFFFIDYQGGIYFGSQYDNYLATSGNYYQQVSSTKIGSLIGGTWNDITVSIVPVSGDTVRFCFYINGVLQTYKPTFTPSADITYNIFHSSIYPLFFFNFTSARWTIPSLDTSDSIFPTFTTVGETSISGPYQMIDNLRMVDFALYDGSSNFTPTPVPFDTNLVYVLPDTSNLKDNTIAVQHGSTVTGYRIGGVRPTFPEEGMVWMPLEGDKIADCQIYNGSYWESVGCRIWTGERWVPAWAFNVVTLADLWDLYGGEDVDSYTEITAGSFYQWFQEQFLELKTIIQTGFDRIANALGVQTDDTDVTEPDENGNSVFTFFAFFDNLFSTDQTEEAGVVEDALDSLLALASRFISSIRDFFAGFAVMEALSTDYFAGIADTLSAASELVSGVWEAIPTPITDVLIACFMLIVFGVLIAIFV